MKIAIVLILIAGGFFYASAKLLWYFSYWGLGASILLLALIIVVAVLVSILTFILRYKKEIWQALKNIIKGVASTGSWQQFENNLKKRWPRLYRFLDHRLQLRSPIGWPLTFGVFISFIFLLFFLGVVKDVYFKNPLVLADLRIIYLFQTIVSPSFNKIFVFFTSLANVSVVLTVVAAVIIILTFQKNFRALKYLLIIISSGLIFSPLTKLTLQRLRPSEASLIELPSSFSLPSGHALMAVCLYGFLAYMLFKHFKKISLKVLTIIIFFVLIIGIGLSRIYLGVHYVSDVLAGWYLGLAVLSLFIALFEIENKFYPLKLIISKRRVMASNAMLVPMLLIILSVIITTGLKTSIVKKEVVPTKLETLDDFFQKTTFYSENLFGETMAPMSFIVVGDEKKLTQFFTSAGWFTADPPTLPNILKLSSAVAKKMPYPEAPMTPSFHNSRTDNLSFEKPTAENNARQRHHIRFWKTDFQFQNQNIWIGTASFDEKIGIGSIIHLPTHKINPDIDAEREFIFNDLKNTDLIFETTKIHLVSIVKGENAAGDKFFTDGEAYIIVLK